MKKNDFDNRLQNDLFPDMPESFRQRLQKTMKDAGVHAKKRPSAAGIFAGAVSVAAAAACLLIVMIGVMGGGKGKINAAAPGEATSTPQMTQSTPMPMDQPTPIPMAQPTPGPGEWKGDTRVIALNDAFDFENREKYEALYQAILDYLRDKGESEPEELWLCAIKSRFVKEDTGNRADGYLSGYYVLAQHTFGEKDGPELYCLSDDFEVLWCTEGSAPGPNHAVNPEGDNYAGTYQGHFLYGMAPTTASVTRGALVGNNPKEKTDVEFSMTAWFPRITERLAGSAHLDAAREYFLFTVSAHDWDSVMRNPILRFETADGNVDVNMVTELPTVGTVQNTVTPQPTPIAEVQGVEYWLSQNMPLVRDFTDDWYGEAAVEQYAEAIRRALLVSGEHIQAELWICGVAGDGASEKGAMASTAYVLALNVGDGEPSPELFYYENGRILWMTQGADIERINVVYHNGNTIVFGKSPAFDNRPLAMTLGKLTLENGDDELVPVLSLDRIRERITGGPYYYSARECYLWKDAEEHRIQKLTVTAEVNGKEKEFALDKVNVLTPQAVPTMAVESGGMVYPGRVTLMAHSLNEDGEAAEGTPLEETMANGLLFKTTYAWRRPLTILTASDAVTVDQVDVYLVNDGGSPTQATGQLDGAGLDLLAIDELPPGIYYLCFHTTVLGPYSETVGRYTYQTDYTIYKVALKEGVSLSVKVGAAAVEAQHIFFVDDPDGDGIIHYLNTDFLYKHLSPLTLTGEPVEVLTEGDISLEQVIVFDENFKTVREGKDIAALNDIPKGNYIVCFYARRDQMPSSSTKTSMDDVEVFALEVTVQ